jgi:hypothetical protein
VSSEHEQNHAAAAALLLLPPPYFDALSVVLLDLPKLPVWDAAG